MRAFYNARSYLRPKLHLRLGLATNDRTQVWLVYADDSIGTTSETLFEHHLLLIKHFEDSL